MLLLIRFNYFTVLQKQKFVSLWCGTQDVIRKHE